MKKKVLSLVLICLLILNSISFAFGLDQNETTKITIIHTNDTHSRLLDTDGGFGFAKISTIIQNTIAENPNTIVVDAGDTLHGKPIVNISKGENAIRTLDIAGYDFMTLGNHDFNYGQERLLQLSHMSDIKMLSANILDKNGDYLFTPYVIKEINGVKVGIFGLTTPETAYKTSPTNVEGLTFADAVEVSHHMVEELKDKTDVIIALAHIGLDESSVVTSKQIAENVEGIDVIIDGHSHTQLSTGLMVNNTLIAQTGEYDKNLGFVNLQVQNGKVISKEAKLLSTDAAKEIPQDQKMLDFISLINVQNAEVFAKVVAKTDIYLDGVRENVRTKETNLGNLSADAVRYASKAQIGFVNGGNIRTPIDIGDITYGKVAELFPFGNTVQVKKISGTDLKNALELSVGAYPSAQGAFLQVSGLKFEFDPLQPKGSRIKHIIVGDEHFNAESEYTVAINDFLGIGGDGYEMFKPYPVLSEIGTYEEVFAEYLNANGTTGCEVSGRIAVTPSPTVPVPTTEPTTSVIKPTETVVSYTVVSGDVLWKIALKYKTSWQELAKYNKLVNPNLIFPGQIIKVPVK